MADLNFELDPHQCNLNGHRPVEFSRQSARLVFLWSWVGTPRWRASKSASPTDLSNPTPNHVFRNLGDWQPMHSEEFAFPATPQAWRFHPN